VTVGVADFRGDVGVSRLHSLVGWEQDSSNCVSLVHDGQAIRQHLG